MNDKNKPSRIGDGLFGGLLGKAAKALKSGGTPKNQKGKRKRTKKEILDSI